MNNSMDNAPKLEEKDSSETVLHEETKKKNFDKEVRALIKQAQETLTTRYKYSIDLGEIRVELVCLNKYLNLYNSTEPNEHYQYFEMLYGRKRREILNTLKDDRWLRTGGVCIQYGDGVKVTKEIEEKRKAFRIMLSDIYLVACELQSKAEQSLDGIDSSIAKEVGGKDLIRPSIILLHLMRIFYHLNSGSDKEQLKVIVNQLEDDLGIVRAPTATTSPSTAPTNGISGLFNMATSMMEKIGIKPPEGIKPPTESDISNVIGKIFNDEGTQNIVQNMVNSLQNCNDMNSAVQTIMSNITNPENMSKMQNTISDFQKKVGNGTQPAFDMSNILSMLPQLGNTNQTPPFDMANFSEMVNKATADEAEPLSLL